MKDFWLTTAINTVMGFLYESVKSPKSERAQRLLPRLRQLRDNLDAVIEKIEN